MSLDDLDNGWPTYVCEHCRNGYDSAPHDVLALGPYGSNVAFCSEECAQAWMNGALCCADRTETGCPTHDTTTTSNGAGA